MARTKASRSEGIAKMLTALEHAFAATYPEGALKGDSNAAKAQRAIARAIAALGEAATLQEAHNAELLATIDKLKAELAA